jgi:hypothetical protein
MPPGHGAIPLKNLMTLARRSRRRTTIRLSIDIVDLKDVLRQIQADCGKLHLRTAPSCVRPHRRWWHL